MFLSGKVEETPRTLQELVIVSYEIVHKKDVVAAQRKELYEKQRELVLSGEELLLSTLNFDLNVGHPYIYLTDAIKKYMVGEAKALFPQVAWSFINDCYLTTLYLQYKPRQIAGGAFFLAAEHLTMDLQPYREGLCQDFDIAPRQLEDIRGQMLELYQKKNISTSQGSIMERSNGGDIVHQAVSKEMASTVKCLSSDTGRDPSKVNLSQSNDHFVHDDVPRPEGIGKDKSESEAGGNRDSHSICIVTAETSDDVEVSLLEKDLQLRPEEVKGEGEKDKKSSEKGIEKMDMMDENDLSEREVEDVDLHVETMERRSQSSLIATS